MRATPTMEQAEAIAGYLGVGREAGYKYLREGCPLDPDSAQLWVEQREAKRRERATKAGREAAQRSAVRLALAARGELERILFGWVRHG